MDPIDAHAAHLRYLNRRPSSVKQREWMLRNLAAHTGKPLLELELLDLRGYLGRPGLSASARATGVSHLRGFYKWAVEEELIVKDPSARLSRPKLPRALPRPMPTPLAGHALNRAPEPIRSWLMLAAYAGLRACEIAQLRGTDFQIDGTPPIILIRESKGGDPSVVPIGDPLVVTACYLSEIDGWCFPKGKGGKGNADGHITPNQVQKRANRYLHKLGIRETLHQLRHLFGTSVYKATGHDLRATQELMRHHSPNSTAGYTEIDPGESARALDLLPVLQ